MKYGRIQIQLRDQLIKKGRINNLGRSYSELSSQKIKPTEYQLKMFIDKLRTEFKVRIVYNYNIKTLYSATLVLMEVNRFASYFRNDLKEKFKEE